MAELLIPLTVTPWSNVAILALFFLFILGMTWLSGR